mgnify:CR=1 FL=1
MVASMTLSDAIDAAATGDVWLFRGRSAADRAIRLFTNSPVNHVGMVIAVDDLTDGLGDLGDCADLGLAYSQLVVIALRSPPCADPTRARALGIFQVIRLVSSSSRAMWSG